MTNVKHISCAHTENDIIYVHVINGDGILRLKILKFFSKNDPYACAPPTAKFTTVLPDLPASFKRLDTNFNILMIKKVPWYFSNNACALGTPPYFLWKKVPWVLFENSKIYPPTIWVILVMCSIKIVLYPCLSW